MNSNFNRVSASTSDISDKTMRRNKVIKSVLLAIPTALTKTKFCWRDEKNVFCWNDCVRVLSRTAWCRIFLLLSVLLLIYISLLGCLSVYPSVWWVRMCLMLAGEADAFRNCVVRRMVRNDFSVSLLLSRFYWFPLFFCTRCASKTINSDVCGFSSSRFMLSSDTLLLSLLVHWAKWQELID